MFSLHFIVSCSGGARSGLSYFLSSGSKQWETLISPGDITFPVPVIDDVERTTSDAVR